MGALANQHSNKTASANARELNLLASLFYLVEFSALTINSNNPDIIVDENENITNNGGNGGNNNPSTVPPATTPPSNENNNNEDNNNSSSNEPIVSLGTRLTHLLMVQ